jgi:hypothetical protein
MADRRLGQASRRETVLRGPAQIGGWAFGRGVFTAIIKIEDVVPAYIVRLHDQVDNGIVEQIIKVGSCSRSIRLPSKCCAFENGFGGKTYH